MFTQSPHDVRLPTFSKHDTKISVTDPQSSPKHIAQTWLDKFAAVLSSGETSKLNTVVHADSWWRDHLALSWDFHTIRGIQRMADFLSQHVISAQVTNLRLQGTGKFAPILKTPIEGLEWVESMFHFETKIGKGKGMLRLAQGDDEIWKAHFIYTALQELKGAEEMAGLKRPHGGNNSLEEGVRKGNWQDRRETQKEFLNADPDIFIIGAGQAGLNMAARLQTLGLSCLIIDKNARIGNNWRHRYHTLVTHDPVQYTHMAYLPFPSNWPVFTPKDKLGDWFEAYASLMELNVWLSTTVKSASYSDSDKKWTITVQRREGSERSLHSNHIVFCTGHSGEPKIPSFPGQTIFKGTVYHGSEHRDATAHHSTSSNLNHKNVVIVGTGNSGHDIAQNYYEAGSKSVTMLQRSGTYVIQANKGLFMMHEGLYDENGPPTEDADVYGQSLPNAVQFALNVKMTNKIREAEKFNIEGLLKAGFKLDFGHDGSGIWRKYIQRGGGYYIDVGASQLIIDGKIKVVQSSGGIKGLDEGAVVLADGRRVEADVVVLATGYDNMRTSVGKILGEEVMERCRNVWDLDREGEVNAMWRPSGHPRFWFCGGSLALCRIYSKFLALQIKAVEMGLNEQ
ncbi:putative flavin-containing monooxygenase YUCCA3 [Delitschia confertaspora ATCC 74209]|uniref:Flavin-containing monooxygenase YUCCA3 n=1 Tax=Delitschia confertaspora ATCC 74209 TaxID=1513339 RepID=A0A9P4JMP1_9PLEO|nr:putative flavin-containing monooxygenase YUCCA3 [Delitschia confertaspora ATCC 74209]